MFNLKKYAQQSLSEQATNINDKGSLYNLDIQIQDASKDLQNKDINSTSQVKQQAKNPEVQRLIPIFQNVEQLEILKSHIREVIPDITIQEINTLTGYLRGASNITDPELKLYMDSKDNKANTPSEMAAAQIGRAAAEAKWNNELKQQVTNMIQMNRKNKPNQTRNIISSVNKKAQVEQTQPSLILPVENIGDFIKKFADILFSGNEQAFNAAQSEVVSNVSEALEQDAQSAFDTLRAYIGNAEEEQEIAAILIKIYGMLPTHQSSGGNTMENTQQQPAPEIPMQPVAKSFNLAKYSENKQMEKTAYTNLGDAYLLYGPTEKRICPKLRGRGGGKPGSCDVVSEEICRFHCLDGIIIDDNKTICGEAVFRANVMDKFSREYVDADGNIVGGYLNKRFEINRNVPEENKMRLKPGETRKPRPPAWGTTESRMQDMRNKEGQKRGYRPVNDGQAFDWTKDVDQNNVEVPQDERDRREEAMGHQTVQYSKRDQGENEPKMSKKSESKEMTKEAKKKSFNLKEYKTAQTLPDKYELASKIMQWHGGQWYPTYAVASSWMSGYEPSPEDIDGAISELEGVRRKLISKQQTAVPEGIAGDDDLPNKIEELNEIIEQLEQFSTPEAEEEEINPHTGFPNEPRDPNNPPHPSQGLSSFQESDKEIKEAKKKEKGTTYKGEHFKVNPWAACNKSTGGKNEAGKEKFERCVKKVKSKSKTSFNLKEYKTAQSEDAISPEDEDKKKSELNKSSISSSKSTAHSQLEKNKGLDTCKRCHEPYMTEDRSGKRHCSNCGTPELPTDTINKHEGPFVRSLPYVGEDKFVARRSAQQGNTAGIIKRDPRNRRRRQLIEQFRDQKDVEESAKALALEE